MIEVSKEQLLILNEESRAIILKCIAMGIVRYKGEWEKWV